MASSGTAAAVRASASWPHNGRDVSARPRSSSRRTMRGFGFDQVRFQPAFRPHRLDRLTQSESRFAAGKASSAAFASTDFASGGVQVFGCLGALSQQTFVLSAAPELTFSRSSAVGIRSTSVAASSVKPSRRPSSVMVAAHWAATRRWSSRSFSALAMRCRCAARASIAVSLGQDRRRRRQSRSMQHLSSASPCCRVRSWTAWSRRATASWKRVAASAGRSGTRPSSFRLSRACASARRAGVVRRMRSSLERSACSACALTALSARIWFSRSSSSCDLLVVRRLDLALAQRDPAPAESDPLPRETPAGPVLSPNNLPASPSETCHQIAKPMQAGVGRDNLLADFALALQDGVAAAAQLDRRSGRRRGRTVPASRRSGMRRSRFPAADGPGRRTGLPCVPCGGRTWLARPSPALQCRRRCAGPAWRAGTQTA